MNPAPGYFGKVPSHGDFVSRRLPPPVASLWDHWLQACIIASRGELDALWLPAYLSSPLWRFALPCGVAGSDAWAGVLMPSVDRVGRHFPLMMGAAIGPRACVLDVLDHGKPWHDALEALALSALEQDFRLDRFDAPLPVRFAARPSAGAEPGPGETPQGQWRFPVAGSAVPRSLPAGHSLWWTDGSPDVAPSVLVCAGLPQPSSFAALLDGCWRRHGWQMPAP
jgi:type VI secretion system protein ImpM